MPFFQSAHNQLFNHRQGGQVFGIDMFMFAIEYRLTRPAKTIQMNE